MTDWPKTTAQTPCRYACAAFPHCGCEVEALFSPLAAPRRGACASAPAGMGHD